MFQTIRSFSKINYRGNTCVVIFHLNKMKIPNCGICLGLIIEAKLVWLFVYLKKGTFSNSAVIFRRFILGCEYFLNRKDLDFKPCSYFLEVWLYGQNPVRSYFWTSLQRQNSCYCFLEDFEFHMGVIIVFSSTPNDFKNDLLTMFEFNSLLFFIVVYYGRFELNFKK